jgi:large subunit ribosomal protein L18e
MRTSKATNPHLFSLINALKKLSAKEKVPLWKRIASDLSKPSRKRRSVNISHIEKNLKSNETALVPGKVLGTGNENKKLKVAAFQFTDSAKAKVHALTIQELMKSNPKGKGVRIIG